MIAFTHATLRFLPASSFSPSLKKSSHSFKRSLKKKKKKLLHRQILPRLKWRRKVRVRKPRKLQSLPRKSQPKVDPPSTENNFGILIECSERSSRRLLCSLLSAAAPFSISTPYRPKI